MPSSVMYPANFVYEFLKNTSNEVNMKTSVDTVYKYTVSTGRYVRLQRINIIIEGNDIDTTEFGAIAALSTGCDFGVYDPAGNSVCDFTGGQKLKRNTDWTYLAGVDSVAATTKVTDDFLPIRFTIAKATGHPMTLLPGYSVRFTVNDNTSAINRFQAMIQGSIHNYSPERMNIASP
jgi:hypothetical protein